ncbi:hypothetical protein AVEN_159473-1 [Araneus ventricosus]|uniref:DNA helicase Pif1-like 2B domain-containing protein n=1 Tax=Araneus ventricosus TaxID=182803 RepID=A0A4Y2A1Q8_ARAVE|nr:hypothetical protein AVEN_159473-1 [Araneus ventricosus]
MSGAPSDKPRLKVGVPVLLKRNLDISRLSNGTWLQITRLGPNVMKATVMTAIGRRESVLNPRLPIIPKDLPTQFKRQQIPLKISFARLKVAGVHLEKPYFSHGQL